MDGQLLSKVKSALGITGEAQDETLKVYIDGIKEYMKSAGVLSSVVDSEMSTGAIVAGVMDTWNYGSGEINLSPYTRERIIQLKYKEIPKDSQVNN